MFIETGGPYSGATPAQREQPNKLVSISALIDSIQSTSIMNQRMAMELVDILVGSKNSPTAEILPGKPESGPSGALPQFELALERINRRIVETETVLRHILSELGR